MSLYVIHVLTTLNTCSSMCFLQRDNYMVDFKKLNDVDVVFYSAWMHYICFLSTCIRTLYLSDALYRIQ